MTRPAGQAERLLAGLRQLGAAPLHHPTIRIADPVDPVPFRRALEQLDSYDWVVFTSANGVARFWHQLEGVRSSALLPVGTRVAAIGPATAAELERRGVSPEVVPEEYVAEAVADVLTGLEEIAGRRVLLPRAAGARQVLPQRLRAAGAEVDEVIAYESRADLEGIAALQAGLGRGEIDMITFTAASTVRHFVDAAGADLGRARVAVIGPVTADAARAAGVRVDAVAQQYTVEGLLRAIVEFYGNLEERD
ncbi:MAG: uroporphyrinogen-III synthase [Gemmatimonadota bacterium]|nr:MAG: uroporphyrinogen-III synthase [Gemmatimonadota bacterium]